MKLPSLRRIFTTDFPPENETLVDKLAYILNINLQVLYDALNKKVDLENNIDCQVQDITVNVNSLGVPKNSTIFALNDKVRNIIGLQVIRAENQTNSAIYPTSGVFVTFSQVQTGIQILHVTGLPADNNFAIKLIAWY